MTRPGTPYAGLATRAVGLAVDLVIVNVIVLACGAILALVGSLVADVRFNTLATVLAAAAWTATVGAYFVLFWSTVGQTPGMRLMGLRVGMPDGSRPGVLRSAVRVVGLMLATLPLFLGFVPVLFDRRRRGLHDYLAGTIVTYATDAIDIDADVIDHAADVIESGADFPNGTPDRPIALKGRRPQDAISIHSEQERTP